MLSKNAKKKGFTLIEIVITIVVIGVSVTGVMALFIESSRQSMRAEVMIVGSNLAEGKMEEVLRDTFADITDQSQTSFASPFSDYSYQVIVDYVSSNLSTVVSDGSSDYKRIQVVVSHPLVSDIMVQTIMTDYNNVE